MLSISKSRIVSFVAMKKRIRAYWSISRISIESLRISFFYNWLKIKVCKNNKKCPSFVSHYIPPFNFAAFYRDSGGPVRFSHLLHAKDDTSILCGVVEAGRRFEVASFLQKSSSLCHQCLLALARQAAQRQRKYQRFESRYISR